MRFYLCESVEDGRVTLRTAVDGCVMQEIEADDFTQARTLVIEVGLVHVPGHGWFSGRKG